VAAQDKPSLSYSDAGVDIERGNRLVETIKPIARSTQREGVLAGLGGFGALFDIGKLGYRRPVLVAGTDGVGTKLRLAIDAGRHATVGIDLVAMCVNDLIVQGAEPLFFLDYFACGQLDNEVAADVIGGIGRGCLLAGAALIGGETAEMPGMYARSDYDLAGFCVGVVEADRIIDGSKVEAGDVLIGIASSGPHSNGYSLIRKILEHSGAGADAQLEGRPLMDVLLEPTRIYVKPVLGVLAGDGHDGVHAIAHITGGGLLENLPRVMPADTCAVIDLTAWQRPAVFDWLAEQGNVTETEMYRTFNCGVGMVLAVTSCAADKVIEALTAAGETAWRIGGIEAQTGDARVVLTGRA